MNPIVPPYSYTAASDWMNGAALLDCDVPICAARAAIAKAEGR